MHWPTADDYCEALQDPEFCFDLPELQAAKVAETPLGLPKAITGRFASVYSLQAGDKQLALRCFHLPVQDLQRRYAVLSRHLRAVRLPFFSDFQYLPEGIKLGGACYPVVKMTWVTGEPLMRYIESNLHDPKKLLTLAKAWLRLLRDLRRNRIAHGDLHHENILVQDGRLQLIDYDGMYVPGLEELDSRELGHRHYQHPKRNQTHFGPYLDHFAGWVVYLSLLALSYRPELWDLADEEHLLFRQEDFQHPAKARVWPQMAQLPKVAELAAEFRSMLKLDPEQMLPPHPHRLRLSWGKASLPAATTGPAPLAVEFKGPDWVLDYLPEAADEEEDDTPSPATPEHKLPPAERIAALAVWLAICGFLALAAWARLMRPLGAALTAAFFGIIQLLGVWFRRRLCNSTDISQSGVEAGTKGKAPGV